MTTLKGGRVANQITTYRRRRGLTIKEVVRLLDFVSNKAYWEWEMGIRAPSLTNALRLSYVFRCPLEVLFFDEYDRVRRELRSRELRLLPTQKRKQCSLL